MEAKKFEPGEKVEAWEIVGPSKTDDYGHRLWLCRCTLCGEEHYVEGTKLRRGLSTSCGCDRKTKIAAKATPPTGPKEDLRGRVFGKLEVLDALPKKSNTNHWEWKCHCNACGSEKYFRAAKLRSGEVTSCGCQRGKKKFDTDIEIEPTESAYDTIQKICWNDNLLDCAQDLLKLVKIISTQENKKTVIQHFYERLYQAAGLPALEALYKAKRWYVVDGPMAVVSYLAITMPKMTSPVQTLKRIEEYAKDLLSSFSRSPRKPIENKVVNEILTYLDKQYNFSGLVFGESVVKIIILDAENKLVNASFVLVENATRSAPGFLLYANHEDCQNMHPAEIFFHELGHAMQTAITGDIDVLPQVIMDLLDDLCFPGIANAPLNDGREVLADAFGIGLMYNTPFINYDNARYMDIKDKKRLAELVDACLRNWENRKNW